MWSGRENQRSYPESSCRRGFTLERNNHVFMYIQCKHLHHNTSCRGLFCRCHERSHFCLTLPLLLHCFHLHVSKWDNIELSDDESDCHPNIDKESWFRLKHRTRVEREDKEAAEQQSLESENSIDLKRVLELKGKLKAIREAQQGVEIEGEDEDAINAEITSLEKKMGERTKCLEFMEKHKKWNWVCVTYVTIGVATYTSY